MLSTAFQVTVVLLAILQVVSLVLQSMEKILFEPIGFFLLQYLEWPLEKFGAQSYCQTGIQVVPHLLLSGDACHGNSDSYLQ